MSVTIFNMDKVERETFKIKLEGKEYEIKEPTVKDFSNIHSLDFEKDKEAGIKLVKILVVGLDDCTVSKLTQAQFNLLIEICYKLLRGEGKKKKLEVEELME